MPQLVIHPRTRANIDAFLQEPTHALLLIGADGIGKGALASTIAASLLGIPMEKFPDNPAVCHIIPDEKGSISIGSIRTLQQFVRLKSTGKAAIRRIILVEHADTMTLEAQNAILKLLEEPPADTVIILTAGHITSLLPTILSRVQRMRIITPTKEALQETFSGTYTPQKITLAYFMSGGLPGLMVALLQEDDQHPLATSVVEAKQILQESTFERMLHVEPLAKQKGKAVLLCEALERIAHAGLQQAAAKNDDARMTRWHTILTESHVAKRHFQQNANAKLVLTNLLLHI